PITPAPPRPTLFPYTTLFRSTDERSDSRESSQARSVMSSSVVTVCTGSRTRRRSEGTSCSTPSSSNHAAVRVALQISSTTLPTLRRVISRHIRIAGDHLRGRSKRTPGVQRVMSSDAVDGCRNCTPAIRAAADDATNRRDTAPLDTARVPDAVAPFSAVSVQRPFATSSCTRVESPNCPAVIVATVDSVPPAVYVAVTVLFDETRNRTRFDPLLAVAVAVPA